MNAVDEHALRLQAHTTGQVTIQTGDLAGLFDEIDRLRGVISAALDNEPAARQILDGAVEERL